MTLHPQNDPQRSLHVFCKFNHLWTESHLVVITVGSPSFSNIFGGLLECLRVPRLGGGSA